MLEGQTRGATHFRFHAECHGGLLHIHRGPVPEPAMIPCQIQNSHEHDVDMRAPATSSEQVEGHFAKDTLPEIAQRKRKP